MYTKSRHLDRGLHEGRCDVII